MYRSEQVKHLYASQLYERIDLIKKTCFVVICNVYTAAHCQHCTGITTGTFYDVEVLMLSLPNFL